MPLKKETESFTKSIEFFFLEKTVKMKSMNFDLLNLVRELNAYCQDFVKIPNFLYLVYILKEKVDTRVTQIIFSSANILLV